MIFFILITHLLANALILKTVRSLLDKIEVLSLIHHVQKAK